MTTEAGADRTATVLPKLVIDVTPTFVIAAAIATRDFQDVHHDRDRAVERGGKDIFLNILTTMGLVQRYVTEQVPGAVLEGMKVRLGAPAYAGDTLTLTGRVIDTSPDGGPPLAATVEVRGVVSLGDHVTATVRLAGEPSRRQDEKGGAA